MKKLTITAMFFCISTRVLSNTIDSASNDQMNRISMGFEHDTGCKQITLAYTMPIKNGGGYIVSAVIDCPGITDEIATWYTSSKTGAMMIISQNIIAKTFTVYPYKKIDLANDIKLLEQHVKQINQQKNGGDL